MAALVGWLGIAAACSGKAVAVTVFDATGTALATGSGTAGVAPFDITTTAFAATAVAGTSGGYGTETFSFHVGNLGTCTRFIVTANFPSVPTFPGMDAGAVLEEHSSERSRLQL